MAMLTFFFDCCEIVRHEFQPIGEIVGKKCYFSVLRCLWEAIRQKRSKMRRENSWILHHNNVSDCNVN